MFGKSNDLNTIKLIDLGLFTRVEDSSEFCVDKCGTLYYMAPEMVYKQPIYNEAVDIWACGIILYIMLSGGMHPISKPLEWIDDKDYSNKLKNINYIWKYRKGFSLLGRNLFIRLCNWNKFQRIDVYLALKHPFITRDSKQNSIQTSYVEKCAFEERKIRFKSVRKINYIFRC